MSFGIMLTPRCEDEYNNDKPSVIIDAKTGVVKDRKGYMVSNADHDWIDLGEAYMLACDALGVKPCRGDKEESQDQS